MKTHILTIIAVIALSACAAMKEGLDDVNMAFTPKEERFAHWKDQCRQMGATNEQVLDCALRQEESYQRRLNE